MEGHKSTKEMRGVAKEIGRKVGFEVRSFGAVSSVTPWFPFGSVLPQSQG